MIETVAYPTVPSAPGDARPAGTPPFLRPGEQIDWHYRRPGWTAGDAATIAPMRVVRDDSRGLVAWLAPGTIQEAQGAPDGRRIRTVPLERRWTERRIRIREEWWGNGVLRIAPTAAPWSVWLFWSGEPWAFSGWYVNLENAHLRAGAATYSSDHVLDVWIDADGRVHLKDEDELEEALLQGRIAPGEAVHIRRHADAAIASHAAGDWPFDPAWRDWRPELSWTTPQLADLPD